MYLIGQLKCELSVKYFGILLFDAAFNIGPRMQIICSLKFNKKFNLKPEKEKKERGGEVRRCTIEAARRPRNLCLFSYMTEQMRSARGQRVSDYIALKT